MNIKDITDANIHAEIVERIRPIAKDRIESRRLHSIADVEEFFIDMSKEGVGDAAIIIAWDVAKQGAEYGITAIRPLREWAEQYRPELLAPPQRT